MRNCKLFIVAIVTLFMLLSCNRSISKVVLDDLNVLVDSVRVQYVPDSRDEVFDISVSEQGNKFVVQGVTSVPEAKAGLMGSLSKIRPDIIDSVRILPDENLGDQTCAVVNIPVADLRTEPNQDAELATQLLLGAVVETLQNEQDWYRVKTPEGYVAWIHGSTLVRMNQEKLDAWKAAPKVIFTGNEGFVCETPDESGQRTSALVFGNLLKLERDSGRFYCVSFPDGNKAFVQKSQSQKFDEWKAAIQLTGESIVQKALALRGKPYLWGGTSIHAMDCSGFVKTVYLKHGIVLRRDASQQVKTGITVDISTGYDNLRPGDLLFFGKKAEENRPERVRHVGIYMGNKEFVHSSGADVHVSSFDPAKPNYDEGNTKEFIYARRILGAVGTKGIDVFENRGFPPARE